jgi:hypothetical protein
MRRHNARQPSSQAHDEVQKGEMSMNDWPSSLPSRRTPQIAIADNEVTMRGDRLGNIWWRGAQWAVTEDGIERLDGGYVIEKTRLQELPWPLHMAGKVWVDIEEFATAWLVGLMLHGYGEKADPKDLLDLFAKLPPPRPPKELHPDLVP